MFQLEPLRGVDGYNPALSGFLHLKLELPLVGVYIEVCIVQVGNDGPGRHLVPVRFLEDKNPVVCHAFAFAGKLRLSYWQCVSAFEGHILCFIPPIYTFPGSIPSPDPGPAPGGQAHEGVAGGVDQVVVVINGGGAFLIVPDVVIKFFL